MNNQSFLVTKNVTTTVVDSVKTGKALRKKREGLSLKLTAVASAMSISSPYLSDLERGRRNWTNALVKKFLQAIEPEPPKEFIVLRR